MAAGKTTKKVAQGKTSDKTTTNKKIDKSSTVESRAERYKRRDLERTASHTGKDKDKSRPMLRRSSGLAKRKREPEDEGEDEEIAEQSEEQSAQRDKECTVCLEFVAKASFPAIDHAEGDEHSSDVCFGCWDQHIESEIRLKSFEGISCLQCPQRLVEEEVRQLANERTYAQYLDKGAKSYMQQDEEFQSCPNADCPWGAFFARDEGNIFTCQMCDLRWCLSCDIPFHHRETCEERRASERLAAEGLDSEDERDSDDERDSEDERDSIDEREQRNTAIDREADEQRARDAADLRNEAELKSSKATRVCPGCNIKIHKIDGCDHMTCKCSHEFCWECLAPYKGPKGINTIGNSAHQDSCRHASRNLPDGPDDSDPDDD